MRTKLKSFTEFTNSLLPHETAYLISIQKMEDPVRLEILKRVHENSSAINGEITFDESIDKRKYSHLKNWISDRLAAVDVDQQLNDILITEQQILTDTISYNEEKQLLKKLRSLDTNSFYFMQFFELLLTYRHFLQIRLRYDDYSEVNQFIQIHRVSYEKSKSVFSQLHKSTKDITEQYAKDDVESHQWEEWLSEVFYDETLDGLNRYMALVRLAFVAFNYRKTEILTDKYEYLESQFEKGEMYSKRILLNHYSNRLLLHSRLKEYDQASYYGYLSIKVKNHDFLYYVVNLTAVLLRQKKFENAYQILKDAQSEMKVSKNFHSKIGFVAFYIKALMKLNLLKNAENYGDTFLRAYKNEILQYRWHLFFSSYLEALLAHKRFPKVIRLIRKFKLLERDLSYQNKASYLPNIPCYYYLALYKEENINPDFLCEKLNELFDASETSFRRKNAHADIFELIEKLAPELKRKLSITMS